MNGSLPQPAGALPRPKRFFSNAILTSRLNRPWRNWQTSECAANASSKWAIWQPKNLAAPCRWCLALAAQLDRLGYEWVVFTATRELISIFNRLGLPLLALAPADPARLGEAAGSWGRYYDTQPVVVAGRIRMALERSRSAVMSGGTSSAHLGSECLFAALAKRSPDAIVLQGATQQTWRASELLSAVDHLAARIAGTRVLAVLAGNGPAWVIADLAALRAGTVHLPLPDFFSQAQLAHALEQTGADSVLTDQPERIAGLNRGFAVAGKWNGLLLLQRPIAPVDLPPGTAKISFTSGSTGAPKGACLSALA
jgi:hypothetical protein